MAERRRIEVAPTPYNDLLSFGERVQYIKDCEENGVRMRFMVHYHFWVASIDGRVKIFVSESCSGEWNIWEIAVKGVTVFASTQAALAHLAAVVPFSDYSFYSWHEVAHIVDEKIPQTLTISDMMRLTIF